MEMNPKAKLSPLSAMYNVPVDPALCTGAAEVSQKKQKLDQSNTPVAALRLDACGAIFRQNGIGKNVSTSEKRPVPLEKLSPQEEFDRFMFGGQPLETGNAKRPSTSASFSAARKLGAAEVGQEVAGGAIESNHVEWAKRRAEWENEWRAQLASTQKILERKDPSGGDTHPPRKVTTVSQEFLTPTTPLLRTALQSATNTQRFQQMASVEVNDSANDSADNPANSSSNSDAQESSTSKELSAGTVQAVTSNLSFASSADEAGGETFRKQGQLKTPTAMLASSSSDEASLDEKGGPKALGRLLLRRHWGGGIPSSDFLAADDSLASSEHSRLSVPANDAIRQTEGSQKFAATSKPRDEPQSNVISDFKKRCGNALLSSHDALGVAASQITTTTTTAAPSAEKLPLPPQAETRAVDVEGDWGKTNGWAKMGSLYQMYTDKSAVARNAPAEQREARTAAEVFSSPGGWRPYTAEPTVRSLLFQCSKGGAEPLSETLSTVKNQREDQSFTGCFATDRSNAGPPSDSLSTKPTSLQRSSFQQLSPDNGWLANVPSKRKKRSSCGTEEVKPTVNSHPLAELPRRPQAVESHQLTEHSGAHLGAAGRRIVLAHNWAEEASPPLKPFVKGQLREPCAAAIEKENIRPVGCNFGPGKVVQVELSVDRETKDTRSLTRLSTQRAVAWTSQSQSLELVARCEDLDAEPHATERAQTECMDHQYTNLWTANRADAVFICGSLKQTWLPQLSHGQLGWLSVARFMKVQGLTKSGDEMSKLPDLWKSQEWRHASRRRKTVCWLISTVVLGFLPLVSPVSTVHQAWSLLLAAISETAALTYFVSSSRRGANRFFRSLEDEVVRPIIHTGLTRYAIRQIPNVKCPVFDCTTCRTAQLIGAVELVAKGSMLSMLPPTDWRGGERGGKFFATRWYPAVLASAPLLVLLLLAPILWLMPSTQGSTEGLTKLATLFSLSVLIPAMFGCIVLVPRPAVPGAECDVRHAAEKRIALSRGAIVAGLDSVTSSKSPKALPFALPPDEEELDCESILRLIDDSSTHCHTEQPLSQVALRNATAVEAVRSWMRFGSVAVWLEFVRGKNKGMTLPYAVCRLILRQPHELKGGDTTVVAAADNRVQLEVSETIAATWGSASGYEQHQQQQRFTGTWINCGKVTRVAVVSCAESSHTFTFRVSCTDEDFTFHPISEAEAVGTLLSFHSFLR